MPGTRDHLATAEVLAGEALAFLRDHQYDMAQVYRDHSDLHLRLAHARHELIGADAPPPREPIVLPPWCGECDGPDLQRRWTSSEKDDGLYRCRSCNPYALSPEDASEVTSS
ncbi:hypothetical protein ACWIGE_15060 [Streptomyces diastaticus]